MIVSGFKLWYADGSTFSSDDGSWSQAPSDGVQVLMIYLEKPLREIVMGVDEYRLPDRNTVKYGSYMNSEEDVLAMADEAMGDSYWPGG